MSDIQHLKTRGKEAALLERAARAKAKAQDAARQAQAAHGKAAALRKKRISRGKILLAAALIDGVKTGKALVVEPRDGKFARLQLEQLAGYLKREADRIDLLDTLPDIMA